MLLPWDCRVTPPVELAAPSASVHPLSSRLIGCGANFWIFFHVLSVCLIPSASLRPNQCSFGASIQNVVTSAHASAGEVLVCALSVCNGTLWLHNASHLALNLLHLSRFCSRTRWTCQPPLRVRVMPTDPIDVYRNPLPLHSVTRVIQTLCKASIASKGARAHLWG